MLIGIRIMRVKPPKARKCKECPTYFVPSRPMQKVCGFACSIKSADRAAAKLKRIYELDMVRNFRARKLELKPLQYWLKRAERAFNAWVRERDKDQPCISCGTADSPEWHAGHLIPATAHATRFDPICVNLQCAKCNVFLGGNQANYAIRLAAKVGQAEVDRLINARRDRKWTRPELQEIEALYKQKTKELKGAG